MADRRYASPSPQKCEQAARSANEIMPGLVIGSLAQCAAAAKNGFTTICVRHERCHVKSCNFSPLLNLETWVASHAEMERVSALLLDLYLKQGKKTYIHCFHGIERAPLAVAYFLKRYVTTQQSFEDCYKFVLRMRPMAEDRTLWLEKLPTHES